MSLSEALPAPRVPPPPSSQAAGSDRPLTSESQGGHVDGAQVDLARKMEEVDHLLANLKNDGKEIDVEIARMRSEAARAREEARRNEKISWWHSDEATDAVCGIALIAIASSFIGFFLGAKWHEEYVRSILESERVFRPLASLTRFFSR